MCRVNTTRPLVALTFDDGPDPTYTPAILELLQRDGAHATFFVLGEQAAAHPALLSAERDAGMEIANHTWSHPHLPTLTTAQVLEEAARTGELLGADSVPEFRAPYGEITAPQLSALQTDGGYTVVHWSVAIDHYVGGMGLSPQEAAVSLAASLQPGDIILAHDAAVLPKDGGADRSDATETLRLLLPELRSRGVQVTTVTALLNSGTPLHASPRPWFWQSGFECR
ncbi:MAG: polysaccharide deacetylase family protein [Actinomycetota bacterium]